MNNDVNASLSMKKNVEESVRVGKLIRAGSRRCYGNARRVIERVEGYANADYVEGIMVCKLPIEHGWVERDGEIIDPTLPEEEGDYFGGIRARGNQGLAEALQRTKDLPLLYGYGWGGIEHPGFRAALIAGNRHAGFEESAQQYEDYETPLVETQ